MRKKTDVKIYITSYFKNLSRERIAIFICIPLALVALLICAIMLLGADKREIESPRDSISFTELQTEKQTYSPDSPYGLEFESLGNGECAVLGIGSFAEKELKIPQQNSRGEIVVEIKANAFKDCDFLEAIVIPSSVKKIGDGAFRGCDSLIYIDVSINNEYFTSISGVLFSKSRSRLIYYPPKKPDERYYLNPNVKTIDDYAFENARSISVIVYPNGTADFEAISIGKGNEILRSLPITCNYTGSK